MELIEKTKSRNILYEGRVFTAAKDEAVLADGSEAVREVVLHEGGAGVLPVDGDGNITLVRQYRYGAQCVLTEVCAGKLEKGETHLECASRELTEELGLCAGKMELIATLYPTPAYCSEKICVYLATDLKNVGQKLDEGEFLETVSLPLSEAVRMIMDGEITDAKTQIAVLKAERMLRGKD
ncbi:MAG: NUDIX hydrolase [Clostridia bacterium]|nr:NUDIX hydrolase [Clostridia bacterium]